MLTLLDRAGSFSPRRAVEAGLVAIAAVQAARLIWALVAPIGPIGAAAAPVAAPRLPMGDLAVLARFDPFHRNPAPAAAAEPAADTSGLKLFGLRSGASAILAGADGRQAPYRIGEQVAPGVTLAAVGRDHVVLNAQGQETRLYFAPPGASGPVAMPAAFAAPPPAVVPAPASGAMVDAAELMRQATLTPRMANGRIDGLAVQPRGRGGEALAQAGLEPGDALLSVNGRGLGGAEAAAELGQELARPGEAVIQFERGGQVRTASIRTRP